MAVTYIDPAQGALGQAFGDLLSAAADRKNAKNIRFKELSKNPQALQGMASAFRSASTPENQQSLADSLGINIADLQRVSQGFAPTMDEEVQEGFRKGGGVQKAVDAGLAGLDLEILDASFKTGSLEEGIKLGLPKLLPRGDVAQVLSGISENTYKGSYFSAKGEGNRIQLQVDRETLADQLGIKADQTQLDSFNFYTDYLESLDLSDPAAQKYALMGANFMTNPGFAGYLSQLEQWDLRIAYEQSQAGGTPDPMTVATNTFKLNDEYVKALTLLEEAMDGGNEARIQLAGQTVNQLGRMRDEFAQAGYAVRLPNIYVVGKGKKTELMMPVAHDPEVAAILLDVANVLQNDEGWGRERSFSVVESMLARSGVVESLNPAQQEELLAQLQQMKKLNPSDKEISQRRSQRSRTEGLTPQTSDTPPQGNSLINDVFNIARDYSFDHKINPNLPRPDTTNVGQGLPPLLLGLTKPGGG